MKHKVQHNTTHPYFFNNQNTNENIIFNTKNSYKKKKENWGKLKLKMKNKWKYYKAFCFWDIHCQNDVTILHLREYMSLLLKKYKIKYI